jgi:uncharacterized alpha-E superfamily protein
MLSRVADSLYWMSRYFERADNGARVLGATYSLILNPAKFSTDQRWYKAITRLLSAPASEELDPQEAMIRLAFDSSNQASIVSCLSLARENAGQAREEISSEMWEQLNRLYHDLTPSPAPPDDDAGAMRLVAAVRDGSFRFYGITDSTINHGEGWHFIQLGKYTERACSLSLLVDSYFSIKQSADDLDWVGLLSSCAAFEAYCKSCTADLQPGRVAEFVLLQPEFPYSVRYSVDQMQVALAQISERSMSPKAQRIERIIGRLRASLTYVQINEVIIGDLHKYCDNIIEQCRNLHSAMHDVYIDYQIGGSFEL